RRHSVARVSFCLIPPCLPSPAERMPSGPGWVHEIKHDGFRVIARKHHGRVRLYSRPGNDLTNWFPLTRRGAGPTAHAPASLTARRAARRLRTKGGKVTTFTSTTVVQLKILSPRWVPPNSDSPKPSPISRPPG